jgi:hypothetical protein
MESLFPPKTKSYVLEGQNAASQGGAYRDTFSWPHPPFFTARVILGRHHVTEVKTNIPYEIGVMTCTTVLPVIEDDHNPLTTGVTKAFLLQ